MGASRLSVNEPLEVTCDIFCRSCYTLTVQCYYRLSSAITDVRDRSEIHSHQMLVMNLPFYCTTFWSTGISFHSQIYDFSPQQIFGRVYVILFFYFSEKFVKCFLFQEMRFSVSFTPVLVRNVTFQNALLCWNVGLNAF